ncbi:MAG: phosphate ABC transporter permease subunit PstC [Oscillospiraceae bacterium]|nr:phosphate ABC transporter permease subunit PstC [Oscillospiraceae bacterium]
MKRILNSSFTAVISALTVLTLMLLAFVIFFIVKEALPLFRETTVREFLLGDHWMPMDFFGEKSYGISNFMLGTLYVSITAMLLAILISIGTAVYLSCVASDNARSLLYPFIDLLAGIPSVIYGFIGLVVLVRIFIKLGHPSGLSVLTAGILLAVMILPFLISSISDTMLKLKERYMPVSTAMGVEKWYATAHIIIPLSVKSILISMTLAIGRAMGETMAVMMVMGNANLFPRLLGKGETIASLIALEMGTAVNGSGHYHALYAAGLVLLIILFIINTGISLIRNKVMGQEGI